MLFNSNVDFLLLSTCQLLLRQAIIVELRAHNICETGAHNISANIMKLRAHDILLRVVVSYF